MMYFSNLVLPLMVLIIIIYGLYKKVDIYDTFITGATDSVNMIVHMFPCMLAMILGINIFINSGVLNFLLSFLKPLFGFLNIPFEIFPMALMRPISGSSTLAILNNIFNKYGPDSFISLLASIIQGSTDTTFYVIALYFGSIGITKSRYALPAGLFADFCGIVASFILVYLFFG